MVTVLLAIVAGVVIGLSLGALGGGGSILAVPVLVYALGQSPAQATTGSLVVVGVTSLVGALTAYAAGNVMSSAMGMTYGGHGGTLGPGMTFGWLAGADAATRARVGPTRS